MDPISAALIVGSIALLGVLLGFAARAVRGRAKRRAVPREIEIDTLTADDLGTDATLVQFVTETCAKCPAVARTLSGVAERTPGVRHVTVDLTRRPDLASQQRVLTTPTTLVLDRGGLERARIVGVPKAGVVETELAQVTGGTRV